jgi:hypothetical protein
MFLGTLLSLAIACTSDDDDSPKVGNGVNDVRAACELRLQWDREKQDCALCEIGAVSPRCECESLKAISAVCMGQENARKQACADQVESCVLACDRRDCTCIEACYATDDCKRASAARDGCVTEACSPHCK